ncbi:MAG: carboxypeptidase regulatory-like domain-containing protein [Verrucomicrobiales bacterium]|nr:carboxypeptidase regulatory-like domain-containing protein [Verrucomicrobiales bacterium]
MTRHAATQFPIFVAIMELTASMVWAQAGPTATIRGTVVSSEGKLIPHAALLYGRAAPEKPKATAAIVGPVLTARTASDGSFTLGNLAAGTWLVCVEADGHLDPCHWSFAPPRITVAAGQAVTNTLVRLDPAYTLRVQIRDPQRLLANEGKTAGARLRIGVRTLSGMLQAATLSSSSPGERGYAVTAPVRSPVRLFVSGGTFGLSDALAAPVPASGKLTDVAAPDPVKAKAGAVAPLTFIITSIGKP